jgi:hypothetical protein
MLHEECYQQLQHERHQHEGQLASGKMLHFATPIAALGRACCQDSASGLRTFAAIRRASLRVSSFAADLSHRLETDVSELLVVTIARRPTTITNNEECYQYLRLDAQRIWSAASNGPPDELVRLVRTPRTLIRSQKITPPFVGISDEQHVRAALRKSEQKRAGFSRRPQCRKSAHSTLRRSEETTLCTLRITSSLAV